MTTRYEIAARHPDGRAYLVAYSPRVSRPGLLAAMRQRSASVIARCGIGEHDEMTWGTKPRVHVSVSGWTIGFTGRTQLDTRHSPLPYIDPA